MHHEILSAAKADLIGLLKRRKVISIKEAAQELDLAASTVRQHLADLEIEGFIDKRISRKGVGRPGHEYFLTEKADIFFQNHEGTMLAELIRFCLASGEHARLEAFFTRASDNWLATLEQRLALAPHIDRLTHLEKLLHEWGYVPRFDTDADGRLVIDLFHCPYRNVADLIDFQCTGEKHLLERLTGQPLCQRHSILDDEPSCRFVASTAPHDGP